MVGVGVGGVVGVGDGSGVGELVGVGDGSGVLVGAEVGVGSGVLVAAVLTRVRFEVVEDDALEDVFDALFVLPDGAVSRAGGSISASIITGRLVNPNMTNWLTSTQPAVSASV